MEKYKNHIYFILIFKLLIIFFLPLTGDEAYFITWANHIDIGFYDHPPMIGWIIYLMQYINSSYVFFRFFSFLSTIIVAYLIYKILIEYDIGKQKAKFVTFLFLISPVDILISLITNDIPLFLFGTLGLYFFILSLKRNWIRFSILAGLFFGLSFLSKYFAVFIIAGIVVSTLASKQKKNIKNLIVMLLVFIPFVLQNLYFNYNCCWNNIMFNFFSRTENLNYNIKTFFRYISFLIYFLTPWGIYYLLKSKFEYNKLLNFIALTLSVPLLVFGIVSLKKDIGLHWFLLFLPLMYMVFAVIKKEYEEKLIKYNLIFTYLHILLLFVIIFLPNNFLKNHKKYNEVVFFKDTKRVCNKLSKYQNIFTTGYTSASILSYHCNKDINMILNNSKYGRLADKIIDIRQLTNKDIFIFFKKMPNLLNLKKIFTDIKIEKIDVLNASFYVGIANGFKYDEYKKNYLDVQKKKYYNIPKWLPQGKCYFTERYYK